MDMIDRLMAREGNDKVTNTPGDPGGLTKFGVSQRSYPLLDIANLTREQAKDLYIQDYYLKNGIQLLPDAFQESVLDFAVHSGPQTAISNFQRLIGVPVDGKIGPQTALAAQTANVQDVKRVYSLQRILFLTKQVEDNPSKLKFLRGWISRVFSLI